MVEHEVRLSGTLPGLRRLVDYEDMTGDELHQYIEPSQKNKGMHKRPRAMLPAQQA